MPRPRARGIDHDVRQLGDPRTAIDHRPPQCGHRAVLVLGNQAAGVLGGGVEFGAEVGFAAI
jgi:hypothetical protein